MARLDYGSDMEDRSSTMSDPSVRLASLSDAAAIATLCAVLWPDATKQEHLADVDHLLKTRMSGTLPATVFVAEDLLGGISGFLQVGLRSHADGCDPAHPVGFVEGWFVLESLRRRGIGRAMMRAAEDWASSQGCKEMASDTWIDETISQNAHQALGFEIVDRCIHFRKPL
uniref:Aminoglycoside N(6')-acetyltransferase type 1 n=1 Tax=uncultured bacterium 282 TaxID=698388 RepID=E3T647_9BACT|nr:aminoglycoside N(6')-acetyltransferase type 1 (aaC(6')) [uncultured bacterium 282]